jgi:PAS domain S-box-containing protein
MALRPLRILLMEDDPNDLMLFEHALKEGDAFAHTLVGVNRLTDGIARLAQEPFDVALMDLTLPDSQGIATVRAFLEQAPEVPLVVLTGLNDERVAEEAISAGAQDYLVKDEINPRWLARALRYAVGRHETEMALRSSRAYLSSVIESSMDVIIAADNERRITTFNEAAEKTFGYRAEEAIGQPVSLLWYDAVTGAAGYEKLLREGRWSGEVMNRRKNGEGFPGLLAASVVRDAHGRIVGTMGVSRDVTELKKQEAVLRESEERFRRAFDDAPIGIALVSRAGRWLKANRALCQIIGYPESELLKTDFQSITHPDDLEKDLDLVRQVLDGRIASYQMEKRYRHKQGGLVTVMLNVSVVRNATGEPLYFISQIENITQRKQHEAEREKLISELQEALASVKTLSGLIPICAWCKQVRDDKGYWQEVEQYVAKRTPASFTHGVCPACSKEFAARKKQQAGIDPHSTSPT